MSCEKNRVHIPRDARECGHFITKSTELYKCKTLDTSSGCSEINGEWVTDCNTPTRQPHAQLDSLANTAEHNLPVISMPVKFESSPNGNNINNNNIYTSDVMISDLVDSHSLVTVRHDYDNDKLSRNGVVLKNTAEDVVMTQIKSPAVALVTSPVTSESSCLSESGPESGHHSETDYYVCLFLTAYAKMFYHVRFLQTNY